MLILDEPTNDLDTDMLAAMEDLLDSWPGTLLVVSHDRYLIERVTDQQYAILDGRLRHLPGGVDEYLRLAAAPRHGAEPACVRRGSAVGCRRCTRSRKEIAAIERKLAKLGRADRRPARRDGRARPVADYAGSAELTARLRALEAENADLEDRWLELSDAPSDS